jgi:hypothetical protein
LDLTDSSDVKACEHRILFAEGTGPLLGDGPSKLSPPANARVKKFKVIIETELELSEDATVHQLKDGASLWWNEHYYQPFIEWCELTETRHGPDLTESWRSVDEETSYKFLEGASEGYRILEIGPGAQKNPG